MTDYFVAHESKSEWTKQTVAEDNRIQVVTNPVLKGQNSFRVEVRPGDNPSGCRATLATGPAKGNLGGEPHIYRTGDEVYFGLSVYLPSQSFIKLNKWRLLLQLKSQQDTGSPPVSLNIRNGNFILNNRPNVQSGENHLWRSAASYDTWERFILHVKFSNDPSVGFLELIRNDTVALPTKMTSTQHVVNGNPVNIFVALGLYRDASITQTDVMYHDGFTASQTLEGAKQ